MITHEEVDTLVRFFHKHDKWIHSGGFKICTECFMEEHEKHKEGCLNWRVFKILNKLRHEVD